MAIELRTTYTEAVLAAHFPSSSSKQFVKCISLRVHTMTLTEKHDFYLYFRMQQKEKQECKLGWLTFNVKSAGSGFISVDVITLNTYNTTIDDIGAHTPRRSDFQHKSSSQLLVTFA